MAILEVCDLIKQYRQSESVITAVNRANFVVEDGEFVAIIGTSGSGKSTLLHICAGLLTANSGHVYIRGQDLTAMNSNELAEFRGKYIGMIFQRHNLIPQLTAVENILLPAMMCNKPSYSYEESFKKIVASLHIENRLNHLPAELSGGQQQRVAIARALINRPQVLFADEPTGNLDRDNAEEVLKLLLETKNTMKQTLVMVTHDMKIAMHADRIFRMDNGILSPIKKETLRDV